MTKIKFNKELQYDNRLYRISVNNEAVHKNYQTSFDDLVHK